MGEIRKSGEFFYFPTFLKGRIPLASGHGFVRGLVEVTGFAGEVGSDDDKRASARATAGSFFVPVYRNSGFCGGGDGGGVSDGYR